MKLSLLELLFKGSALFYLLISTPTAAQIVPDTTLSNNSIVPPGCNNCEITGGTAVGSNLFHSFEQFSVPTDGSAVFSNASTIENIISRVTGGSISEIDGLIGANNSANLLLINPKGIIFGPNASLDIGGSFLASTASSVLFADGTQFSATDPQAQSLLTVSVPVGLGLGDEPGQIAGEFAILDVPVGETLALVGGNLSLEGVFLTAAEGKIELGSVAGKNIVSLTPNNRGWVLDYEGVENFRDISLSQAAFVGAGGDRGGNVQIQGDASPSLKEVR